MHVKQRTLTLVFCLAATVLLPGAALAAAAQSSQPEALNALRTAVSSEMEANRTDKSIWMYRQQRAHKASAHDDAQAAELLKMLPDAFIWTIAGQDSESVTLRFEPSPNFNPPDMQSRVMGIMTGEMIIARDGNRIRTLRGKLSADVLIGWGILGKLDKGGTFDVERRMIVPGHWQITETDVHIGGHALLFKTIGQQEDEAKTDWRPSTAETLEQAARILKAGD